jgi:hypothetical protein
VLAVEQDCTGLTDRAERLACFDLKYPANPNSTKTDELSVTTPNRSIHDPLPAAKVSAPVVEVPSPVVEPTSPVVEAGSPAANTIPKQVTVSEASAKKPTEPSLTTKVLGFFDKVDKHEIYATISGLENKRKQRIVFRLDNNQTWIQNSARDLFIKKGDRVTIKTASGGGHILRSEHGISTRVRLVSDP